MSQKAVPMLMDSGTLFVEWPVCANCGQPIERAGSTPVRSIWVHSDGRNIHCRRGNR